MANCAHCSAELPDGAKFCQECGTPAAARTCPACGAITVAGGRFCNECGHALAPDAVQASARLRNGA